MHPPDLRQPPPSPYAVPSALPSDHARRGVLVPVLVTALIAGLMGLLLGISGTLGVQWAADRGGPPGASGPVATVLPARLPELVSFVEKRLGVEFEDEPEVTVLADDAFEDVLTGLPDSGPGHPQEIALDDFTSTATALGLVEDGDAFDAYQSSGYAEGVLGFYDTSARAIWLRGTSWGPTVEVTLVHELVHALQDQVVDLDLVTSRTRVYDESYLALAAVVEGHASVVEQDWIDEQGEGYADAYWDELDDYAGSPVGEPFAETMFSLRYDLGWYAVSDLEARDGHTATLEVIADAPTTLEQLWEPRSWRDGDASMADPVEVPEPVHPAGSDAVDRGSLGAHVLSMLTLHPAEYFLLIEERELPLQGWAGDEYVTWVEDDERSCTRVLVAFDDADDVQDAVAVLRGWAEDGGTLTPRGTALELERCQQD